MTFMLYQIEIMPMDIKIFRARGLEALQ